MIFAKLTSLTLFLNSINSHTWKVYKHNIIFSLLHCRLRKKSKKINFLYVMTLSSLSFIQWPKSKQPFSCRIRIQNLAKWQFWPLKIGENSHFKRAKIETFDNFGRVILKWKSSTNMKFGLFRFGSLYVFAHSDLTNMYYTTNNEEETQYLWLLIKPVL